MRDALKGLEGEEKNLPYSFQNEAALPDTLVLGFLTSGTVR
jgi:hypothetical protein